MSNVKVKVVEWNENYASFVLNFIFDDGKEDSDNCITLGCSLLDYKFNKVEDFDFRGTFKSLAYAAIEIRKRNNTLKKIKNSEQKDLLAKLKDQIFEYDLNEFMESEFTETEFIEEL